MIKGILQRFALARFDQHIRLARIALEMNRMHEFNHHRNRAEVWSDRATRWGPTPEPKEN